MALAARVRPIIIATGPVTWAGRIFSTLSLPPQRTRRPATMDTRPEKMMPNWAAEISSGGRILVALKAASCSAVPSAATMLAMAVR